MNKSLLLLLIMMILVTSCNFPSSNLPNPDLVKTQVALLLTTMPTSTKTTAATQKLNLSTPTVTKIPETQTSTQTPTVLATATGTAIPNDPSLTLGTPTWTNPSDWSGFYLNSTDAEIQITQDKGNLVFTAVHANEWHGWSLTYIKGINFYLEATFKTGPCSGLDQYGLVFRAPDTTQGYFFSVSCSGEYSLRKWISNGFSDTDLIGWTNSPDILTGGNQVNKLGVKANGNQYALYVNGKLLSQATDDTFLGKGIFGAHIASVNTSGFEVDVQSMQYWSLP